MRTLLFSLLLFVSTATLSQEVPADSKVIPDNKNTYISADSISAIIEPFVRKKAMIMLDDKEITFKQFKSLNPQEYKSPIILTPDEALEKFGKMGKMGKNGVIILTSKPDIEADEPIYTKVERMPEFPGGLTSVRNYIYSHLQYPSTAIFRKIQGKVFVGFVINRKGKVDWVKVVRGVHPLLDAEAVRVVSQMPAWKPGFQADKPVNVRFVIPIEFRVQ
ncbi:MAG: energy transducer TonB [Bacteroidia bacterium]|nr:energy transducer TonB [Bacteroidia bacterium]